MHSMNGCPGSQLDEMFMREAMAEAQKAFDLGEAPVGAVIVRGEEIIARGHNLKEKLQDPTAHAEMLAIREASRRLGSWRLLNTTVYVTLEPCAMCAGAMVAARIPRLVYGAPDPKAGAAGSVVNIVQVDRFNHRMEVTAGVLKDECAGILQRFFARLRAGDIV